MALVSKVEIIPIRLNSPNREQSTVIVKLTDANGIVGIGEADGPAEAIKAYVEQETLHCRSRNIGEMLVGMDPLEFTANWDKLYNGSIWQGARGLGIFVLSGIDMAMYDLAGKQLGVPAYKLLGGAQRDKLTPYFTLSPFHSGERPLMELLADYLDLMDKATSMGAKAVKLAIMSNSAISDEALIRFIQQAREALGDKVDMMVDFLYRWRDPYAAARAMEQLADSNLYFAEAVLQHDHLAAHKILVERAPMRICGAEMATTRWECRQWLEQGKVAVLQPDINRAGGLTELRRIGEMADYYGAQLMPHGWKTGITAAAGRHFQAASKNTEYFEYLHSDLYDSPLRRYLVVPEPDVVDGQFPLPTEPGLGIRLNEGFLAEIGVE